MNPTNKDMLLRLIRRTAVVLLLLAVVAGAMCASAAATGTAATPTPAGTTPDTADTDNAVDIAQTGTLESMVNALFGEDAQTVDIIILLTLLTLLPSIIIMFTGFTRIVIILSFIRNAMGTQQTPPNQVIIGLALFLTFFVMKPVLTDVYDNAYVPYSNEEISQMEMLERALVPTREFMLRNTYDEDLGFFADIAGEEAAITVDEESGAIDAQVSNFVLIPAFLTSEIKHAFIIGFLLYIPFIVIDMVVSSTLMSMGMMMLPPAMISMPFKIMLFVFVDGWQLIIGSIIQSFK